MPGPTASTSPRPPAGDSGAVLLTFRRSAEPLGKPTFGDEGAEEFPYDD